ncbi:MAG: hypothetical protein GKR96_13360 [Gammaproteobacteria bacterium]|nr:hypothetical protein [Gammaproteobacteria bacterium]
MSDEQLALDLSVNRPLFEKLVEQFEPNPKLEVVHPHWLKPKGALMDEEWNWYQIKFKQLRLDAGIRRYKSNQIWLISTARGLSIGGSSKGYVFNPPDHGKYYQNLDSRPPDLKEAEIGYKRLDSDWAVGYRWSD